MDGETWTLIYMVLILKIPIAGMIGIVWWALKQQPDPDFEIEDGDDFRRHHDPLTPRPIGPRRGPGAVAPPVQTEGRNRAAARLRLPTSR